MRKQFIHTTRAWYYGSGMEEHFGEVGVVDEIIVNVYDSSLAHVGEYRFRWHKILGQPLPTPRLEVFDDGWRAFVLSPELFGMMANFDNLGIQPLAMMEIFYACGYEDMTPVECPL